jgi:hypothetical protein
MLGYECSINLNLRSFGELTHKLQICLVGKSPGEPKEWFLEIVVAIGDDDEDL